MAKGDTIPAVPERVITEPPGSAAVLGGTVARARVLGPKMGFVVPGTVVTGPSGSVAVVGRISVSS